MRKVAVGHGQFATGRRLLELIDRGAGGKKRFVDAARVTQQAGERAQRVGLGHRIACELAKLKGSLLRLERTVEFARQVVLVGQSLEEVGAGAVRKPVPEAECAGVLGGRLAVGPERRRAPCSGPCVAQHRHGVIGSLSMVGEAGGVDRHRRRPLEGLEDLCVQRRPAIRSQRVLDGKTDELVPERQRAARRGEETRGEALVDIGLRGTLDVREEPEFRLLRND